MTWVIRTPNPLNSAKSTLVVLVSNFSPGGVFLVLVTWVKQSQPLLLAWSLTIIISTLACPFQFFSLTMNEMPKFLSMLWREMKPSGAFDIFRHLGHSVISFASIFERLDGFFSGAILNNYLKPIRIKVHTSIRVVSYSLFIHKYSRWMVVFLRSQDRTGQVRTGQVKSEQVKSS